MPTVEVVAKATARGRIPKMINLPTPLAQRFQKVCDEKCMPFTVLAAIAIEEYLKAELAREQQVVMAARRAERAEQQMQDLLNCLRERATSTSAADPRPLAATPVL